MRTAVLILLQFPNSQRQSNYSPRLFVVGCQSLHHPIPKYPQCHCPIVSFPCLWCYLSRQCRRSAPRLPRSTLCDTAVRRLRRKEPETLADNEPRISEVPTGLVVAVGRLDKRVVAEASAFVTSHAAGESGMGPYTGGRRARTPMRLPNSRSICTSHAGGEMATTSKIGCEPRRNSGVTRNCEVPRNIRPRIGASFARGN